MKDRQSSTAPSFGSVLTYVAALVWRAKWLIGGATIVAAAVAFALAPANTIEAWSGRAILRIALIPTAEYILLGSGTPLAVADAPRTTVALISDPEFRHNVASKAAFEPATANLSSSMVSSSLRATVLDSDRDIAVELSAGSAADVQAAYRAISEIINEIHGKLINERFELLKDRVDDAKSRIAMIESDRRQLEDRVFSATTDDKAATRNAIVMFSPESANSFVNALRDRIEQADTLKKLTEPTVLRLESDNHLTGSRSVQTLRLSLLAGLAMLIAMTVLTVVLSPTIRTYSAEGTRSPRR